MINDTHTAQPHTTSQRHKYVYVASVLLLAHQIQNDPVIVSLYLSHSLSLPSPPFSLSLPVSLPHSHTLFQFVKPWMRATVTEWVGKTWQEVRCNHFSSMRFTQSYHTAALSVSLTFTLLSWDTTACSPLTTQEESGPQKFGMKGHLPVVVFDMNYVSQLLLLLYSHLYATLMGFDQYSQAQWIILLAQWIILQAHQCKHNDVTQWCKHNDVSTMM